MQIIGTDFILLLLLLIFKLPGCPRITTTENYKHNLKYNPDCNTTLLKKNILTNIH